MAFSYLFYILGEYWLESSAGQDGITSIFEQLSSWTSKYISGYL